MNFFYDQISLLCNMKPLFNFMSANSIFKNKRSKNSKTHNIHFINEDNKLQENTNYKTIIYYDHELKRERNICVPNHMHITYSNYKNVNNTSNVNLIKKTDSHLSEYYSPTMSSHPNSNTLVSTSSILSEIDDTEKNDRISSDERTFSTLKDYNLILYNDNLLLNKKIYDNNSLYSTQSKKNSLYTNESKNHSLYSNESNNKIHDSNSLYSKELNNINNKTYQSNMYISDYNKYTIYPNLDVDVDEHDDINIYNIIIDLIDEYKYN